MTRSSLLLITTAHFHASRTRADAKEPEDEPPFDITQHWEKASKEGREFFKHIYTDTSPKKDPEPELVQEEPKDLTFSEMMKSKVFGKQVEAPAEAPPDKSMENDFFTMATNFAKMSMGDKETQEKMLQEVVERARATTSRGDFNSEAQSFRDVLTFFQTDLKKVADSLDGSFGHINLSQLTPTSIFYFLEFEDERKNPSWKRRMHRFHSGIDIKQVAYLNDMLQLSILSYADSVEEIAEGVKSVHEPLALVYCDVEGRPNKPGHFIALKKNQSVWSSELEVLIVVRGTKTVTDVMTDLIVDAVDYRGGKAHSGILESGRWLVEEHKALLEELRKLARKRSIKITLVGHSLGAGAATIAGMEFNDMKNISAEVVGFGCPSLLNPELAQSVAGYVTTVISDSDIVPRMSGATVANVLLDMMEFDWTPRAKQDIAHALGEAKEAYPFLLSDSTADSLMGIVDDLLKKHIKPTIKPPTTERVKPVLAPPGMCVHLYADGSGVSGAISPGKFFQEIDITRKMVQDHQTALGYQYNFLALMRQHTNDFNFTFDDKGTRHAIHRQGEEHEYFDN